ncbi:ABC transporter substrate-binding protein [Solicola sp. PLA-1-18]|uniref:ABC transporter substrate-binding protein n=1 Tax=Solicola sp. PLA-1-18 TaxID=3380532 RepID=UPI003B78AEA3
MTRTKVRWASAAVALTVAVGLAGCGGSGSGDGGGDVTLRVSTFGTFGYEKAYEQFEKDHPGVTVVESDEGDLGKYGTQLTQRIAAGNGAGDVVAIEEGQIVNFLQAPDKFVNFQEHGSNERKDQWLDWKYAQATTADGSATIGLGTDVGGLAMCYRRDLFEKAGLPTERTEVAKLWPTWDAYVATGKKFKAGIGDDRTAFLDAATNTYNSILMQGADETYFDRDDRLVIDSNPVVKDAWDTAVGISESGLSARLKAFSNEWNAGFKNGAFATIACPAWMTGYIKDQSGEANAGKWDITTVPGGAGSWGGSFLAVPTQGKNQKLAIELAEYLSGPDGQLAAFEKAGNLPSNPTLYDRPELKSATNPYFNDAPIGQLFVAGAQGLEPVYLGAKNQPVRDAVENAMRSVEGGQRSPAAGWKQAVKAAEQAAR